MTPYDLKLVVEIKAFTGRQVEYNLCELYRVVEDWILVVILLDISNFL